MADTGGTDGAFVNVQHVLGQTEFTEGVLTGSGDGMGDKVLTDVTEYRYGVHVALLLLIVDLLVFFLMLLVQVIVILRTGLF